MKTKSFIVKAARSALPLLLLAGAGAPRAQTADQLAKLSPKELAAMVVDQAAHMADLLDSARSEVASDAKLAQALARAKESAPKPVPGAGPWIDAQGGVGFELASGEMCSEISKICVQQEGQGRCACSPDTAGRLLFAFILPPAAP